MKSQNPQAPSATAPATPVRTVQHATPGPWRVHESTYNHKPLIVAGLTDKHIIWIAEVNERDTRLEGQPALANARLIAAAPAMLAACKAAHEALTRKGGVTLKELQAVASTLRTTIARAEGDQP